MTLRSRVLVYLVVVVAALSLIAGFVSYRAIATNEPGQLWQPLSALVTPAQLTEIVAESTAPGADREAIADSAVGYQQNDLLLVDFNTPDLCGIGGCALAGYRPSTGEPVLAVYVERTSPDEPIVGVLDKADFELPCLLVPPSQEDSIFQETEKDTLCYQDGSWSIQ
ncbi:hypothetical protein BH23CYA1_BH23CYA1_24200 [soil metagenome]